MQEHKITVKSADMGLTWEAHLKAKTSFQLLYLKRILKFSIGALGELTKDGISEENVSLIKNLLCIAEGVLTWGFVHHTYILFFLFLRNRSYFSFALCNYLLLRIEEDKFKIP